MNLAAIGVDTGHPLDLGAYVEAVHLLEPLPAQRYDEMGAGLSWPAHPPGTRTVDRPSSAERRAEGERR